MPVLPRTEPPEVFCRFRTGVLEKLHLDAARRRPSDGHIKEHDGISSGNRLEMWLSLVINRLLYPNEEKNVAAVYSYLLRSTESLLCAAALPSLRRIRCSSWRKKKEGTMTLFEF